MTSGLEWNIKLSQYDSGDILEKIRATFEGYWNNLEFTPFIAALDSERLRKALRSERRSSQDESNDLAFHFDLKPYYYQQEILDKLKAEREVHHSFKNLVVAATGTGKTVIAAFDYRDFCRANPNRPNKLLFVVHRKEILSQSMSCFRGILKDLNFGSMMVGGVAEKRVGYIINAMERYCLDPAEIIGIGFCLSKKHAEFMAQVFNKAGIPSEFLVAESESALRDSVKRYLVTKEITFVFVVDIYNEGIDITEVNTVLFLRLKESLTVFLQQLGRGLRLCEGKEALTVLDFVGQAHQRYSFEDRFKALLSRSRKTIEQEIKTGFANVLYQELMDLLDFQFCKINFVDKPLVGFEDEFPLDLYCAYTFDQI